jgi:TPR repeat protein
MKTIEHTNFLQWSHVPLYGKWARIPAFAACLVFVCWLILFPSNSEACGWWGDGESDDDVIEVDSERDQISDEEVSTDDPKIQTTIGNRYKTGEGAVKNYEEAVNWYRKAAEQGFAGAQNNLAVMYEKGLGVPKDDSEAAKWYQRAAEKQDAEAAKWYQRAAEKQDAHAQHSLGIMYLDGRGIPQDFEEAFKWIRKSAEQGHHGAFRDMGEMYWKGLGVSQNDVLACMWWKLAVMHGDEESERLLSKATAKMPSSSVIKSEKLAKEWMQNNK